MMEPRVAFEATAPARVDLAGGTLDIWPLYLLVKAPVTVNAAIQLRARSRVRVRGGETHRLVAEDISREISIPVVEEAGRVRSHDPLEGLPLHEAVMRHVGPHEGMELITRSGVPAGSGLGGSSALAVSMLAAVAEAAGEGIELDAMIRVARDLEADVLEMPTGTQDHLAAVHGGVGAVLYGPGLRRRIPLPVRIEELEAWGTLAFLGASRVSGKANWDMVRRAIDGDAATRRGLTAIAAIACEVRMCLGRGQLDECARLIREEWTERSGLSPEVSTPMTEAALKAAMGAGAVGGKICGAGGGGCLFVMGPPDVREAIGRALAEAGCVPLEFRVDREGLRVTPST
jgi:D-glycero-alpha-D-manno-heptose-7-phosphate kinase